MAVASVVACILGLVACGGHKSDAAGASGSPSGSSASPTAGSATQGSSVSGSTTPGSSASGSTESTPATITAAQLGSRLTAAASKLTSAHLALTISASGQNVTAVGDEKLAGGKLAAFRLAEQVGAAKLSIVVIGQAVYVQLPSSTGSQKYVQATPGSKNAVIQQLSATLNSAEQSASPEAFSEFARAATSVTTVGAEQVGTTPATHYKLVVDVSKLPKTAANAALQKIKTLPIDLWVDAADRPVRVSERLTVGTEKVATDILVSRFNAPVSITKPPTD